MESMKWILLIYMVLCICSCTDGNKISGIFHTGPKYVERRALGPDGYEFFQKESGETGIMKNDSIILEDCSGRAITYLYHPNSKLGLYVLHVEEEGKEPLLYLYNLEGKLMDLLSGKKLCPFSVDADGMENQIYFERHVEYTDGFSLYDYNQKKYTEELYEKFDFELDESGNVRLVIGIIDGDCDFYGSDLLKKLPGRYSYMSIKELPGSSQKVRYMENEFGFAGIRTIDMEVIVPEVFDYIQATQWPGDEDDDIFWIVTDEDNHYGLYTYDASPIIGVEHGIDGLTLKYRSSEDFRWILAEDNYGAKLHYSAVNEYGRQQTKEYDTSLFYQDGNFYYLTHKGADEGYQCENPKWSAEYFSVQSGLNMKVYVYDDGIRLHSERNGKHKYKGYENGYNVYEGDLHSDNQSSRRMTYYVNKNGLIARQSMTMTLWTGMPVFNDHDTYYTRTPMSLNEYRLTDFSEYYGDSFIEKTSEKVREMISNKTESRERERRERLLAYYSKTTPRETGSSSEVKEQEILNPSGISMPVEPIVPPVVEEYKRKQYEIEYSTAEKLCSNWYQTAMSVSNGSSYIDNNDHMVGVRSNSSNMSTIGMRASSEAKMKFEQAQRDLINIRQRANMEGITLSASRWETTTLY